MRSRKRAKLPWRGFSATGSVLALAGLLLYGQSCALFFPDRSAPKNKDYQVIAPPAPWHKLAVGDDPNAIDAMKADVAYENPETGAIISLNSICRKYNKTSLDTLTDNLVRGVSGRKMLARKEIKIAGADALDSLFEGTVDGVLLHLRTVVLIKNDCTYDFIHVSIPKREAGSPKAFDDFLASFQGG